MSGVSSAELILLVVIGLVVLGPKRLPEIANTIGSWIGQARRMTRIMKRQLEDELKRRIAEKREPEPAESGDAKARAGEVVSIEEIESRIAHGYYSEAERLLLDVIARTPGNHRAKLLHQFFVVRGHVALRTAQRQQ